MLNPLRLYFVPTGQLGQLSYWLAVAAFVAVCIVVWPVMVAVAPLSVLTLVYVFSSLAAKRLRDIGLPGRLAAAPAIALLAYLLLLGIFSLLTIGCCGAGTGGDPVSRILYRMISGHDGFFIVLFPLVWLLVGIVPASMPEVTAPTAR